jgi:hypothetical protein
MAIKLRCKRQRDTGLFQTRDQKLGSDPTGLTPASRLGVGFCHDSTLQFLTAPKSVAKRKNRRSRKESAVFLNLVAGTGFEPVTFGL